MTKEQEQKIKEEVAKSFNLPESLIDKIDIAKAVSYLLYLRSPIAKNEEFLDSMDEKKM